MSGATPSGETLAPDMVGPYEVVKRLGHGGQGQTFKIRMPSGGGLERFGCLKMLHTALALNEKALRRFKKEAEVASALTHRNLTAIIDYDLDHVPPYLIYQMIDGVNLAELGEWQKLAVDDVLYIASEIAMGLHYAHNYRTERIDRVVHRDVAPRNVMVSDAGDVLLTDFGLSKFQGDVSGSITNDVTGTPAYLPPEALEHKKLDDRSDMYAFGVVLYELSAGRRPSTNENVIAVVYAMIEGSYPDIAEVAPQYPRTFHDMVRRLMSRDMALRPSAKEVLEVLSECGASRARRPAVGRIVRAAVKAGVSERPLPPPTVRTSIPVVPRRRALRKGALALVAAAALAMGVWWGLPEQKPLVQPTEPVAVSIPESHATTTEREPEAAEITSAAPTPAEDPPSKAKPKAIPPKRATLQVRVIPWGEVTVDGERRGRAPVRVRLAPGKHRIKAISGKTTARKTVRLAAGKTRTVTLTMPSE